MTEAQYRSYSRDFDVMGSVTGAHRCHRSLSYKFMLYDCVQHVKPNVRMFAAIRSLTLANFRLQLASSKCLVRLHRPRDLSLNTDHRVRKLSIVQDSRSTREHTNSSCSSLSETLVFWIPRRDLSLSHLPSRSIWVAQ